MSDRNKRPSAQDLLNEGNFLFSEKCSFEEAFPQIESIKVEYEALSEHALWWGPRDPMESRAYVLVDKKRIGEFLPCPNSKCYGGGFSIGEVIRDMVRNKETAKEGTGHCRGYEGSPKGRKRYRDCRSRFTYKVSIVYRD